MLFDSPPVLAATDAALLGIKLDGALLAVRAGDTRRDHTAQARQTLERVHVRIVGAVLTNAPRENQVGLLSASMKGLILSGGKGTRLYPLTYTRAKQLIPVANKPVLVRVIEAIREAGVREIGIVVGHTAPEIQAALGDGAQWDVALTYIPQPSRTAWRMPSKSRATSCLTTLS